MADFLIGFGIGGMIFAVLGFDYARAIYCTNHNRK